jgi:hypothetical protein
MICATYLPFGPEPRGGRVHVVIYLLRPDASRQRIGSVDLPPEAVEEFSALWERGGGAALTRAELGIPGPVVSGD